MIRLTNVHKEFENGTKALKGVSMQIDDGEFVFLVGPSGSGKSTIIRLITGELEATSGRLMVNGYNLSDISVQQIPLMRRTLGVVFQDFRLIEKKTVAENLEVAMRAAGATAREIGRRVPYILGLVGLEGKEHMLPTQLSGGEQQRVAIARALVNKPFILLADEPTGNLDAETAWDIMQLIERINTQYGTTVIVVTHDRSIVDRMNKRVIEMKQGEIIRDDPARTEEEYDEYYEDENAYQDVDSDGYDYEN